MKTVWGENCGSLLEAAMRRRLEEAAEAHGSELASDAEDNDNRRAHIIALNAERRRNRPRVQLDLWEFRSA